MQQRDRLIFTHATQLVTPHQETPHTFPSLHILTDAAVAIEGEQILGVGVTADILEQFDDESAQVFDLTGKLIAPGFVDCHTHPVFAATRQDEFEMRISGKSYQEIAAAGGGIKASVRRVRQASEELLYLQAWKRLDRFLGHGTTVIEAKSGYGLNFDEEVKLLKVIRELNQHHPVELVPTFLGAHEVPEEYINRKAYYIEILVQEMIPAIAEQRLAVFCDVFCEERVYSLDESRKILEAAQRYGLIPKIHAEQLSSSGAARLAAEIGAISADHLDYINDDDIAALSNSGLVPVILPGAVFFLGLHRYAPARKMIQAGLSVALATDFNPGSCPSQSMPMMMALACTQMKMSPAEAFVASTLNGAKALNLTHKIGRLTPGYQADVVIYHLTDFRLIPYYFGMNFVDRVIKKGKIVHQNTQCIGDCDPC